MKNTNEQHKYKSSEDFHHLEGQMKSLKTIMSDKDTKTREEVRRNDESLSNFDYWLVEYHVMNNLISSFRNVTIRIFLVKVSE